jgi:hypothetical protein
MLASHPHSDLADLLVRLQVAMSLDDLLQREGLGDDRLQAVGARFGAPIDIDAAFRTRFALDRLIKQAFD